MDNGLADGGQPSAPSDVVPGRWQQRAGFSVFFDAQATGPGGSGELRRRTRLYHEETGNETTLPRLGTGRLGEVDTRPARVGAAAVRTGRCDCLAGIDGDHRGSAARDPHPAGMTRWRWSFSCALPGWPSCAGCWGRG